MAATGRSPPWTRSDQEALAQISQFGGSLGGPIVQDQTFWFFAPEMQQASKPVQVLYSALDRQNLRGTPGAMALLGAAPEEEITAISDSLSVINRLDHQITDNHALFGRFDYISNASNNNPGRNFQTTGPSIQSITNRAASGQAVLENTNYTAVGQLTSFLSPNHINELRFQWARESRPRSTVGTGPEVTIWHGVQEIGTYGPQASGLGFGNLGFSSADARTQLVQQFLDRAGWPLDEVGIRFLPRQRQYGVLARGERPLPFQQPRILPGQRTAPIPAVRWNRHSGPGHGYARILCAG